MTSLSRLLQPQGEEERRLILQELENQVLAAYCNNCAPAKPKATNHAAIAQMLIMGRILEGQPRYTARG